MNAPIQFDGVTRNYSLFQSSRNFSLSKKFNVTRNSFLIATIDYHFFPGHIYMRLEGRNLISPYLSKPQKSRTFSALLGDSRYADCRDVLDSNDCLVVANSKILCIKFFFNFLTPQIVL